MKLIRDQPLPEDPDDLRALAVLYRQVVYISAAMLHGQRTQVYTKLTIEEFRQGEMGDSMLSCRRMGGKESGRYGPATAVFLQEDVEATTFFLETLRPHLPVLQSQP